MTKPRADDSTIRFIAIVDDIDEDAVLDFIRIESGVAYEREAGEWLLAMPIFEALTGSNPPRFVEIASQDKIDGIVAQVDSSTLMTRRVRTSESSADAGWQALERSLVKHLGAMNSDDSDQLTVQVRRWPHYRPRDAGLPYVQLAAFGDGMLRVEASGNGYLSERYQLSEFALRRIHREGWRIDASGNQMQERPATEAVQIAADVVDVLHHLFGTARVTSLGIQIHGPAANFAAIHQLTRLAPEPHPTTGIARFSEPTVSQPLADPPKAGAFVQNHLQEIFDHISTVDREEFQRLLNKEYSYEQFRLSFPFFKSIAKIHADGDTNRFWAKEYIVQGQTVRVCSQWTKRHRPFVLNYLVSREIPTVGISATLYEEWIAIVESAGTVAKSPGGARHRTHPMGNAQNSLVRYLLSNLRHEEFKETDWIAAKDALGNRCVYCDAVGPFEMDHAIPLSRLTLGEHRLGNLVPACKKCNGEKSKLRFHAYLSAKYELEPEEADARIGMIESHMDRHGYRPLSGREDIRELIAQARNHLALLGAEYIELINQAIEQDESARG